MPAETDVKRAADLAEFRVETERRFGRVEQQIGELRTEVAEFRGGVQTELGLIRKLGDRFLAIGVGIIGTIIVGSATIAWAAAMTVSDVRHQGERIDQIEIQLDTLGKRVEKVESRLERVDSRLERVDSRLDTMGKQLETLLSRIPAKSER